MPVKLLVWECSVLVPNGLGPVVPLETPFLGVLVNSPLSFLCTSTPFFGWALLVCEDVSIISLLSDVFPILLASSSEALLTLVSVVDKWSFQFCLALFIIMSIESDHPNRLTSFVTPSTISPWSTTSLERLSQRRENGPTISLFTNRRGVERSTELAMPANGSTWRN